MALFGGKHKVKRIFLALSLLFGTSIFCFARPTWYVPSSTYGATSAQLSGDFNIYNSTRTDTPYFTASDSNVVIVGNIAAGSATINGINFEDVVASTASIFSQVSSTWTNLDDRMTTVEASTTDWTAAYDHKTTMDALNGLIKGDGAGGYSTIVDNSTDWNNALSESSATAIDKKSLFRRHGHTPAGTGLKLRFHG